MIRLNRQTQALEPGLAVSWKVSEEGRGRPTSHESLLIKVYCQFPASRVSFLYVDFPPEERASLLLL